MKYLPTYHGIRNQLKMTNDLEDELWDVHPYYNLSRW